MHCCTPKKVFLFVLFLVQIALSMSDDQQKDTVKTTNQNNIESIASLELDYMLSIMVEDKTNLQLTVLCGDVIVFQNEISESLLTKRNTRFKDTLPVKTPFPVDSLSKCYIRIQKSPQTPNPFHRQDIIVELSAVTNKERKILAVPWGCEPTGINEQNGSMLWKFLSTSYVTMYSKKDSIQQSDFGTKDTNYAISVGVNFDFLNKIKTNDLYYGARFFSTRVMGKIGAEGGFNQSRTITEVKSRDVIVENYTRINKDTATKIISRAKNEIKTSTDITTFYVNTILCETQIGYVTLNFEYRRKSITIDTAFNDLSTLDSMNVKINNYDVLLHSLNSTNTINEDRNYFGLGLITKYDSRYLSLYFSLGILAHPKGGIPKFFDDLNLVNRFFAIHLPSRVKLGGEVRFNTKAFSTSPKVEYQIYLAKEFPLSIFEKLYSDIF